MAFEGHILMIRFTANDNSVTVLISVKNDSVFSVRALCSKYFVCENIFSHDWEVLMFFNPLDLFHNYVEEAVTHYLDPIRGNHPEAFTRSRKVSLSKLLFQMTDRRLNMMKLTLYLGRLVGLFLIKTFLKDEVYSILKLCMLWRMGLLHRFMTTLMTVFRSGMILSF